MRESQSPMDLDSNANKTRDDLMKVLFWLITAIVLGAAIFICMLVFNLLLRGNTTHYRPANFEAEFEKSHAKWDKAHVTHYKIVVDFSGYGAYDQMPWSLEIQNDKIISVINAQGNSVPVNDSVGWLTIAALFLDIEDRYRSKAPSIQVSYNPTYGYPEDISINPYKEPCCQEYEIKILDFQILP